jgi:hypothetical protein
MRTTLAIDDDVLIAATAVARQSNRTIGEVVSGLARRALRLPMGRAARNGIPLLSVKAPGVVVTLDIVNALSDAAH